MPIVAALLVSCAGTVALAYWAASGNGSGTGITGTATAVTVSAATPTTRLHPGGRAEVALTITNPNSAGITITSLALDSTQGVDGFAVDAGHAGCATSTLAFTRQTNAGAGWSVPGRVGAADGTRSIVLPDALAMADDAADACQGALFTVYLTAGA